MSQRLRTLFPLVIWIAACATARPDGAERAPAVSLKVSASRVERYDLFEATLVADRPLGANPFTDVVVSGVFTGPGVAVHRVEGFCDDPAGKIFRVRYMPSQQGGHRFTVALAWPGGGHQESGTFEAREAGRRGPVRVDPAHPHHFLWEGTGQHYFWNGTTTYGLLGWDDETIARSIDRLARLGVNRIRATLHWRVPGGQAWYEPVSPTPRYSMAFNPWPAARPNDVTNPGFDVTRFEVEHFRKYERLVRLARERDMVVSVIPYVDGARKGTDPFGKERMGGEDERRYYRYIVARLAAFSNVMWDVTNEYHLFRDEPWVETMGTLLKEWDPYDHLTSVHGHGKFPFRRSSWVDFAMYQAWDEGGGYAFMLKNREEQKKAGRPMPQVNEEYGYEDHYPPWGGGKKAPQRDADNRRKIAWEISMAGGYQTTGERANGGTGHPPDTGGGWINGRGDDAMILLRLHGHLVDFMTRFDWWRAEPRSDLVEGPAGTRALVDVSRAYAVYLPRGGAVTVSAEKGRYEAWWFDPRSGRLTTITPSVEVDGKWTSPAAPSEPADGDWALLLKRKSD